MSKISVTQPTNLNQLNVVGFEVNIARLPNTEFFCQRVNVPGVILGETVEASPFMNTPLEGDTLTFESLTIGFILDEDMQNYIEIYNWLVGLGSPSSMDQYRRFQNASINQSNLSDATLSILSSKYNPNLRVKFTNMFPESISQLLFTTTASDIDYLEATVSFRYSMYTIESL